MWQVWGAIINNFVFSTKKFNGHVANPCLLLNLHACPLILCLIFIAITIFSWRCMVHGDDLIICTRLNLRLWLILGCSRSKNGLTKTIPAPSSSRSQVCSSRNWSRWTRPKRRNTWRITKRRGNVFNLSIDSCCWVVFFLEDALSSLTLVHGARGPPNAIK